MLELFRDPLWQFVGAVLGLAALAGAFLIYNWQRQRKSISYDVISKNQLLTLSEELEGKLQILYDGEATKDICLLVLSLFNSGNVPVVMTDYERPISLGTGKGSHILSAVVTEQEPNALAVDLTVEPSRVVIQPLLLNAKDRITLKLLVSDFCGVIIPDARIVGVQSISRVRQSSVLSVLLILIVCLIVEAVGFYFLVTELPRPIETPSDKFKLGAVLVSLGYVTLIVGPLFNKRFRGSARFLARIMFRR